MMTEEQQVEVINACLMKILGSTKFVDTWWESQNYAFDMMTPSEMWLKDRNKVMNYVLENLGAEGS